MIGYNTPQWYEAREGRFTASNFYKLMSRPKGGGSGWSKTALDYMTDIARQKMGITLDRFPATEAMEWGLDHEEEAIHAFEEATNQETTDVGFIIHPEWDDVGATPDAAISEDKMNTLVQVKCPYSREVHKKYCHKISCNYTLQRTKSHYYWQVQGEMWVTGANYCYFVSYDPRAILNKKLHYVLIERDNYAIDQIRKKIKRALSYVNDLTHSGNLRTLNSGLDRWRRY